MKYTLEHLQKLKEAYATGALEVRFGEHKVVYRSVNEMVLIIETIEKELGINREEQGIFVQPSYNKGVE